MESLMKYPALQSDFKSGSVARNLVDMELPANMGVVDLSRSYVSVKVLADKPNAQIATGIVNAFCDLRNEDLSVGHTPLRTTSGFIRHASMFSAMKGKVEEIREVLCLRNNLAHYAKNDEQVNGAKGNVCVDSTKQEFSATQQNELVGVGNEASREQTIDIHIPLSEIFDSCSNTGYDTNAMGRTSFHFEFNFDRMFGDSVESNLGANTKFKNANRKRGGQPICQMSDPVTAGQLTNASGGNVAITDAIITASDYPDIRRCPFYNGQVVNYLVQISDAGAGTDNQAIVEAQNRIKSITRSGNTDKLVITLENDAVLNLPDGKKVDVLAGGLGRGRQLLLDADAEAVVRTTAEPSAGDYLRIDDVELVVQADPSASVESPFVFATYPSEQDTYAPRNSLYRNYEIPPNCRNVFIFFTPFRAFSVEPQLSEYRLSVDNVDVLGRKVFVRSPMDVELKNSALTNAGIRVSSLEERRKNIFESRIDNTDAGSYNEAIMFPVEMKQVSQKLGLELVAKAGQNLAGHHIIYYECLKQL